MDGIAELYQPINYDGEYSIVDFQDMPGHFGMIDVKALFNLPKVMKPLHVFKITRNTRKWKKGQLVFTETIHTGANATWATGKYRKTGRWINCFVHWEFNTGKVLGGGMPDCRYLGEMLFPEKFWKFIEKRTWA